MKLPGDVGANDHTQELGPRRASSRPTPVIISHTLSRNVSTRSDRSWFVLATLDWRARNLLPYPLSRCRRTNVLTAPLSRHDGGFLPPQRVVVDSRLRRGPDPTVGISQHAGRVSDQVRGVSMSVVTNAVGVVVDAEYVIDGNGPCPAECSMLQLFPDRTVPPARIEATHRDHR